MTSSLSSRPRQLWMDSTNNDRSGPRSNRKLVKDQIVDMVEADEIDDVVTILAEMQVKNQAEIISEFSRTDDKERAAVDEILRRIRKNLPKTALIDEAQAAEDGRTITPFLRTTNNSNGVFIMVQLAMDHLLNLPPAESTAVTPAYPRHVTQRVVRQALRQAGGDAASSRTSQPHNLRRTTARRRRRIQHPRTPIRTHRRRRRRAVVRPAPKGRGTGGRKRRRRIGVEPQRRRIVNRPIEPDRGE